VGQDESQVDSILACTILSSCGRSAAGTGSDPPPELILLHDGRDEESEQRFDSLRKTLWPDAFVFHAPQESDAVVKTLYEELLAREEDPNVAKQAEKVLIVRNIGQFRNLRKDEDDFGMGSFGAAKELNTAGMFSDLLKRGPLVGLHAVVWSDTFSNMIRWLSSSLLREFENRIAFRMNQTDSASLVDSPVAASLSPGRAVIYRDQTGATEKFRPFAWPSGDWLKKIVGTNTSARQSDFDIDSLTIE
jgi:hypothetical protein